MDGSGPLISVILPTFNSANTVGGTIDSIIGQSYRNWELLVINDYGSDDGTCSVVEKYAGDDDRIRLINLDRRFGLAESLNLGIKEAKGKYIARADADDISYPDRFRLQIDVMEKDESVGICGSWQQHYGKKGKWVHRPSNDPDYCNAFLLFACDLCHSTLMIRKELLTRYDLSYDPNYLAEDFELWTRCMCHFKITNIQKILGDHEVGSGITGQKLSEMSSEHGKIVAKTLKNTLDMDISDKDTELFNQWVHGYSSEDRKEKLGRLKELLTEIFEANCEKRFFDKNALLAAIASEWYSAYFDRSPTEKIPFRIKDMGSIFRTYSIPSLYIRIRNRIGKMV